MTYAYRMTFSYICEKCGATLTIETDVEKEARKRLAKYQKSHKCKVKKPRRAAA